MLILKIEIIVTPHAYRNRDIENIEPGNYMEPRSLKFHIEPALTKVYVKDFYIVIVNCYECF